VVIREPCEQNDSNKLAFNNLRVVKMTGLKPEESETKFFN
jgi:hypothetical protein